MTFIEILQLTLVLVIAIILVTAYFVKPAHSHIIFKSPPALIRVNTPRKNWSDVRRTIKLPNGKDYVIPIEAKGHFVLILDWVLAQGSRMSV